MLDATQGLIIKVLNCLLRGLEAARMNESRVVADVSWCLEGGNDNRECMSEGFHIANPPLDGDKLKFMCNDEPTHLMD